MSRTPIVLVALALGACGPVVDELDDPLSELTTVIGRVDASEGTSFRGSFIRDGELVRRDFDHQLDPDGSFRLLAPTGATQLIVTAFDPQGEVGSAVIERVGPQTTYLPPLSDETTAEARLVQELYGRGGEEDLNTLDLRDRVGPDTAAALGSNFEIGHREARAARIALADVLAAAQRAEVDAIHHLGLPDMTQGTLLRSQEEAAWAYNEGLHRGDEDRTVLDQVMQDDVEQVLDGFGITLRGRYLLAQQSGVALRLRAVDRLMQSHPTLFRAIVLESAGREARRLTLATTFVLEQRGAEGPGLLALHREAERLRGDVAVAETVREAASAFDRYLEQMIVGRAGRALFATVDVHPTADGVPDALYEAVSDERVGLSRRLVRGYRPEMDEDALAELIRQEIGQLRVGLEVAVHQIGGLSVDDDILDLLALAATAYVPLLDSALRPIRDPGVRTVE